MLNRSTLLTFWIIRISIDHEFVDDVSHPPVLSWLLPMQPRTEIKRCNSPYNPRLLARSALNTFKAQPLSLILILEALLTSLLAIIDGILRINKIVLAVFPNTCNQIIDHLPWLFYTSCGISVGSFCKSPSMVIM